MAAPAYRSSSVGQATPATTISNASPAGLTNGDILVLYLYYEDSTPTVTPPTGFAELTNCASHGTHVHQRVYWKRAASESGSYVTSFNGASTYALSYMGVYSGAVASGTPVEDSDKTAGTGNATLPSIDTLSVDTLVIGLVCTYNWSHTWSSAVMNEHVDTNGQAGYWMQGT